MYCLCLLAVPFTVPVPHQVVYIPRVPQCLSSRPNWDPPNPQARGTRVFPPPPPPGNKVGEHTRLRVRGWGVPIWTTGEKT